MSAKKGRYWDDQKTKCLREKDCEYILQRLYCLRMMKLKKISLIVLTSLLIIPLGLAGSLKSGLCIEWVRGKSDSTIFCVMNSDHNEGSRDEASNLWIKSPMECCGNMISTSLHSDYLANLKRDSQPSVKHFSIPRVSDILEFSSQTIKLYQESWVNTSDPPIKIFKEVNSYII